MRKVLTRALAVLVCFAALFSSVMPALAAGTEIGTNVSVLVEAFEITSQTEDFTLGVGESQQLGVTVSQAVQTYLWEVSTDGGATWGAAPGAANAATYDITNAQPNKDPDGKDVAYQYRVTVTSASGATDSAIIKVLVSSDYSYRTISLRNGDTDVSAYMHERTRLVVTPIADSAAATVLEGELAPGCLPLILYDVSLRNQDDQVVPYFGEVQVDFHVGSVYDGMTLRAFHLHNNTVIEYSGPVTGGILTITVNQLSPFMVEVPAAQTRTVTVTSGPNGALTPSGTVNVEDGGAKTFTFLPDAGYEVEAVLVDGLPVSFTGNSYTISNVRADHTLSVTFRQVAPSAVMHTVTVTSGPDGTLSPTGTIKVQHGLAQTFYFYPDPGYELDTLLINGVPVSVIGNSYTISAMTANATVAATFRQATTQPPDVYKTITASSGTGGSISPAGDVSVEYGGGMYFYMIPNAGYEVDTLTVDGNVQAASGNAWRFINVIDAHTIHATFKQSVTPPPPPPPPPPQTPTPTWQPQPYDPGPYYPGPYYPEPYYPGTGPATLYPISGSAGRHGRISPAGNVLVEKGGLQTFYFIPDPGYEVDTLTIDGRAAPVSGNAYSFTNVTAGHTIRVTFKRSAAASSEAVTYYYTISATSGGHGSISPAGEVRLPGGSSQTFHFIPDAGYAVDAVTVDGAAVPAALSYRFDNVNVEHTIHVTFKELPATPASAVFHTVTLNVDGGGSISPSGDVRIADNGAQTFYFIPDEGYAVEAIYVNGEKQDVVGSQFTLDHVTEDTELRLSFKPVGSGSPAAASPHCFLCARLGRNAAPWCWLIPLVAVAAPAGAGFFLWRRRR